MSNIAQFKLREPPKMTWHIRIDRGTPNEPGVYWELPGKPPTVFHRWMMRLAFGWRVTNKVEE